MSSLYLVNPKSPIPSYTGGDLYRRAGLAPATLIAELALPTVAALAPDDWRVRLCDEQCEPVELDPPERFIGLTGKVNQWPRARELAAHYRAQGKTVLLGGSFATLSPDTVRPYADVLVRGELEPIAKELFADLAAGSWRAEYEGGQHDFRVSPLPRWDLYPHSRAAMASVQTSRGCPFECEFCDVIVYLGRKQRHKPTDQVLAELDAVYALGFRQIYLADDNLTVYRRRTRELMTAIRDWNRTRTDGPVRIVTQLSIDLARDPELLALCADAGLTWVFIGIESSDEDSLREAKKRQNLVDLVRALERFSEYGIATAAGMIVGFDHDDASSFERQLEFIQRTPAGQVTVSKLVAPEGTPLETRMRAAGRLREGEDQPQTVASPLATNIVPLGLSAEELDQHTLELCTRVWDPAAFEQRMLRHIELFGTVRSPAFEDRAQSHPRALEGESAQLLAEIASLGPREARMLTNLTRAARAKPAAWPGVAWNLIAYLEARGMFAEENMWRGELLAGSANN